MLGAAMAQAARSQRGPECATLEISMNLSTRQLTDPGLVTAVADVLDRLRLPAHLLDLETPH
ncbi:hypothetical protein GCM10027519_47300 [Kineococcus endophyticus]